MKITLTKKELFEIIQKKFNVTEKELDKVAIQFACNNDDIGEITFGQIGYEIDETFEKDIIGIRDEFQAN